MLTSLVCSSSHVARVDPVSLLETQLEVMVVVVMVVVVVVVCVCVCVSVCVCEQKMFNLRKKNHTHTRNCFTQKLENMTRYLYTRGVDRDRSDERKQSSPRNPSPDLRRVCTARCKPTKKRGANLSLALVRVLRLAR